VDPSAGLACSGWQQQQVEQEQQQLVRVDTGGRADRGHDGGAVVVG